MNIKFLSVLLLVGFTFVSCSKKEDLDKKKSDKKECIYLLFPQTWTMPDGSDITLADKEDATLKEWYENNPDIEEKPELVYPVDIKNKEGDVLTISNEEEMIVAKKDCEGYKMECIYVLFPQTWTMPDGSDITLADKEDATLKEWHENNPDIEEKPELVYPVDIKNKEGDVLTISNEEEMIIAKKDCEGYKKGKKLKANDL